MTLFHRADSNKNGAFFLVMLVIFLAFSHISLAKAQNEPSPGDFYKIKIDLPEIVIYNLVITDSLPKGLIYDEVSLNVVGAELPSTTVSQPNDGTDAVTVTWTFDQIDNYGNLDLLMEFNVMVANNEEVIQDGTSLEPCQVSLQFKDLYGHLYATKELGTDIQIGEPELYLTKDVEIVGDTVAVTLSIFHAPTSHSDAFDVIVRDNLTKSLKYKEGSIEVVYGPDDNNMCGDSVLTWYFDKVALYWGSDNKIILRYEATIDVDGSDNNGAGTGISWKSAPGDNLNARTYTLSGKLCPEMSVSIEPDQKCASPGSQITYTYTIFNEGDDTIFDIELTDTKLGFVDLDRTTLPPGDRAKGTKNYLFVENDFPGPIENYAIALGYDPERNSILGIGQTSVDLVGLIVNKFADTSSINQGALLSYTIAICNLGNIPIQNVVVKDVFDKDVELIKATPKTIEDGLWTFEKLAPGWTNISFTIRVPKFQDLDFGMKNSVSGEGFLSLVNNYNTGFNPFYLTNEVMVNYSLNNVIKTAFDIERVKVTSPGTALETLEHGSGLYGGDEQVTMKTVNKSIEMNKDVIATYGTTTLGLYNNRTVVYSSRWTEGAKAKNRVTGATMTEHYGHSTYIDRESRMFLDENESVMEVSTEFEGMGHIGFLKMPPNTSLLQSTSLFEAREDYTGSFKVLENTDEYGSTVASTKSVEGRGLVVVDKRVAASQRSYEVGTGSYNADEHIETNTNYMAKEVGVEYVPMTSPELATDHYIDSAIKWNVGMESKTEGISYIVEEYTNVEKMAKTTVARGLNEMDTEADFTGNARYRAVLQSDGGNETEINLDEQYDGDYSIMRRILFTGVPKYDRPHLNVTKTLDGIVEETKFGAKTMVQAGESRDEAIVVATYTISIENDGNKALGPIYVRDVFPPNTNYINASVRPSELTSSHANWTLTHLAIGDTTTIVLNLDVTELEYVSSASEMVNSVEVCGGYSGDEWACAYNYSALETGFLSCDIDDNPIAVTKTGKVDSTNSSVVMYRIAIENRDDATRVATVTDSLPYGMGLIDSTVPFASYENNVVVWNMIQIEPFQTVLIEYDAEALWSGRFENFVEVVVRSVNGSIVQPVYAKSIVEVGEVEKKITPTGWHPPDWGFVSTYEGDCELAL